jgi:hypothetical protein
MKIPDKKALDNGPEPAEEKTEVLKVGHLGKANIGTLAIELEDPKDYVKYVKRLETIVRGCPEYRQYITFLVKELHLDRCTFLAEVRPQDIGSGVKLEMHHGPLTLFDICSIVLNSRIRKCSPGTRISAFSIADEVMLCHYENIVPLVPLSNTAHELVHSGKLFIGTDQCFGDLKEFVSKYGDGFTIEQKDRLAHLVILTHERRESGAFNTVPNALERTITVLDVAGIEPVRSIDLSEFVSVEMTA